MSDISMPVCRCCGQAEYACQCAEIEEENRYLSEQSGETVLKIGTISRRRGYISADEEFDEVFGGALVMYEHASINAINAAETAAKTGKPAHIRKALACELIAATMERTLLSISVGQSLELPPLPSLDI